MEEKSEIERINETYRNAFEAVQKVYNLAETVREKLADEIAERLELKKLDRKSRGDKWFLTFYGTLKLTSGELLLHRYRYSFFSNKRGTQRIKDNIEPFILASIVTKRLENPEIIYGTLEWERDKEDTWARDLVIYWISENRKQGQIEEEKLITELERRKNKVKNINFKRINLFEFNNETIEDLSTEIINWFREVLKI